MPARQKVSDNQVIEAYEKTKNLYKAAELLGICGSSLHERLVRLKVQMASPKITPAEDKFLVANYESYASQGRLDELAAKMQRQKTSICRRARTLGLTNQKRKKNPAASEDLSKRMIDWHSKNPHPKGMLGKIHSPESTAAISTASKQMWDSMTPRDRAAAVEKMLSAKIDAHGTLAPRNVRGTWKAGYRVIGNIEAFYRSRWEANYARYLDQICLDVTIKSWEHEPEYFALTIDGKTRRYLPDFRVQKVDGAIEYHEVKGWLCERSKAVLAAMASQYPGVKVIVIDKSPYRQIEKQFSDKIPGWEVAKRQKLYASGDEQPHVEVVVQPL